LDPTPSWIIQPPSQEQYEEAWSQLQAWNMPLWTDSESNHRPNVNYGTFVYFIVQTRLVNYIRWKLPSWEYQYDLSKLVLAAQLHSLNIRGAFSQQSTSVMDLVSERIEASTLMNIMQKNRRVEVERKPPWYIEVREPSSRMVHDAFWREVLGGTQRFRCYEPARYDPDW